MRKKLFGFYLIPSSGTPMRRTGLATSMDADAYARTDAKRMLREPSVLSVEIVITKGRIAINNTIVQRGQQQ